MPSPTPPEVLKLIEGAAATGAPDLDLSARNLTDFPPELSALDRLRTLNLTANQITEIPAAIAGLAALESLDLSTNPLTDLPAEIGDLAQLTGLNLENCGLVALPGAIGRLTAGRTTMVVAHRLSTVHLADRVVVLEHGRIVECGRPEDLLAADGRYARLTSLQNTPLHTVRRRPAVPDLLGGRR